VNQDRKEEKQLTGRDPENSFYKELKAPCWSCRRPVGLEQRGGVRSLKAIQATWKLTIALRQTLLLRANK
jgi:hypothetical protein